jgi:hypothetical protein
MMVAGPPMVDIESGVNDCLGWDGSRTAVQLRTVRKDFTSTAIKVPTRIGGIGKDGRRASSRFT